MIVAVVAALAMVSSIGASEHGPLLGKRPACQLATEAWKGAIAYDKTYSISATYLNDGMHGSGFELPECSQIIWPKLEGPAAARVAAFHASFDEKCGAHLVGDHISGVFTGHFIQQRAQLYGMSSPMLVTFFVIDKINSADENPNSITCPK